MKWVLSIEKEGGEYEKGHAQGMSFFNAKA
jgi:hypothetical protein